MSNTVETVQHSHAHWNATAAAALLLTSIVTIIAECYYPGLLNWDSVAQLTQARSGLYDDWHPPLLTYAWGLLDRVWPGTAAILIVNLALLSLGVFLILRSFFRPVPAAVVASLILLSPPILGVAGMIAKDATLLGFFALTVGLTLTAERAGLGKAATAALLAAALACLVVVQLSRHNALPLTGLAGYAVLRAGLRSFRPNWDGRRPIRRHLALLGTAFALFAAVALSVSAIGRHLLHAQEGFPYQHILIYDLAALSIKTGTLRLDPEVFPPQDLAELERTFTGESVVVLPIREIETKEHVDDVARQWIGAIKAHPQSYLAARYRLFHQLIGLPGYRVVTPFFKLPDNASLDLSVANPRLNRLMVAYLDVFADSIVDRAWVYGLAIIAGIAVLLGGPRPNRPEGSATLAIMGVAALLYTAPYFVIAPSSEFRYVAPVVLSGMLIAAVAIRQAAVRRRPPSPG